MNNVMLSCLFLSSVICMSLLFSGTTSVMADQSLKNPGEILQKRLMTEFTRPNPWGYCMHGFLWPHLDPSGLTYEIDFLVNLTNMHVDTIEEAEILQISIYRWNFFIANAIREMRPFLNEFPMTPRSFQVSVGFLNDKSQLPDPPHIASVIMDDKQLEFNHFRKGTTGTPYDQFVIKKFDECPQLAEFFRPIVPRSVAKLKIVLPTFTYLSPHDDDGINRFLFTYSEKECRERNLFLVSLKNACKYFDTKTPFQIALWGHQKLSLNETRKLVVGMFQEILDQSRLDQGVLKFMQEWHNDPKWSLDLDYPEPHHIAMRLSFWDENIDRPVEPFIAEVRLYDKKFSYFTADENQVLVLLKEESYDEALALVSEQEPQQDK